MTISFDRSLLTKNFPFTELRPGQEESIEFVLKTFESGKKFAVLEGPTGSGKSAIGVTIANYFNKAYYVTPQKILQDQFMRDFIDQDSVELKGRTNYPCIFYDKFQDKAKLLIGERKLKEIQTLNPTCETGFCKSGNKSRCLPCLPETLRKGIPIPPDELAPGHKYCHCPYYDKVFQAKQAHITVMNSKSFLYQTQYGSFKDIRDVLILDEAHGLEQDLMSFVTLDLYDHSFVGHFSLPKYSSVYEYVEFFLDRNILQIFGDQIAELEASIDANFDYKKSQQLSYLRNLVISVSFFLNDVQNHDWVVDYTKPQNGDTKVTFRPVYCASFADQLLFAKGTYVLLMSATILDANLFTRNLGIKPGEFTARRMNNRFPKENRPIIYDPAAKMTGGKDGMNSWGPKLIKKVDILLSRHTDERGIIHTHNFAIAKLLLEGSKFKNRFFYQNNFDTKDDMLEAHSKSTDGIILAPAMHEGLDLKDSLSRFQIICKVPYPNFFDDKQLGQRAEDDRSYIDYLTALKLVQSSGRSIRSETDWAKTYIIDESFAGFKDRANQFLPKWFKEAIIGC